MHSNFFRICCVPSPWFSPVRKERVTYQFKTLGFLIATFDEDAYNCKGIVFFRSQSVGQVVEIGVIVNKVKLGRKLIPVQSMFRTDVVILSTKG